METKKFKTINEIEEFLKKHPEMKTGFINVGFEKKQEPVEGEVEKLEAMQEEIIAIQMELSEIKRKHPCIDSFEAKYTIGTSSRFDFCLDGDKFVSNIIIPNGDDDECNECISREEMEYQDFWNYIRERGGIPQVLKDIGMWYTAEFTTNLNKPSVSSKNFINTTNQSTDRR